MTSRDMIERLASPTSPKPLTRAGVWIHMAYGVADGDDLGVYA